jgi:hypothetical protein
VQDADGAVHGDGLPRDEALQKAGPVRLRPILMTTIAMIFGMLPSAVGVGEGSESRQPMAIARNIAIPGREMSRRMPVLPFVSAIKAMIGASGRSPGGPLVRKARPKAHHIRAPQPSLLRSPGSIQSLTKQKTASVSQRTRTVSVVTMLLAA